MSDSAFRAVLENLGNHLKARMPSLKKVIYEFPNANVQLDYPTLSIFTGQPVFSPLQPYQLELGAVSDHTAKQKLIIGMYDFTLQLDFWCRDKVERFKIFEEFLKAFNPDLPSTGLNLQMNDYHEIWCAYSMDRYEPVENEGSSQRAEWRGKVMVLANTRAVLEKKAYVIETIENTLDVTDDNLDE